MRENEWIYIILITAHVAWGTFRQDRKMRLWLAYEVDWVQRA